MASVDRKLEDYELRGKDFRPLVGLIEYSERNELDLSNLNDFNFKEYFVNCLHQLPRYGILGLCNGLVLGTGSVAGSLAVAGIVSLLT